MNMPLGKIVRGDKPSKGLWSQGLADWVEGDTAFVSVAFTWKLQEAFMRCVWYREQGYKVRAGGPGLFTKPKFLQDVATMGGDVSDAVAHHNPMATFASRGCPVGCWFCIVPKMEGRAFTLLPEFTVRPVLCDNNLSALPAEYQEHIIERYKAEGVPLLDANSGFEPATFTDDVFNRWKEINRGAWRFAYDESGEKEDVRRVMQMLRDVPAGRKRVYVLIGNEPIASCLERLNQVREWGGEPHAQPYMKLNTLVKRPQVRHDWDLQTLRDMARWANRRIWRYAEFSEYRRGLKS